MRQRVGDKLKEYRIKERDKAHWIIDGSKMIIVYKYKCSNCGNREREKTNFCSYCGAVMGDEKDE